MAVDRKRPDEGRDEKREHVRPVSTPRLDLEPHLTELGRLLLHLRLLASELGHVPSVGDYLAYRAQQAPWLPTCTWIYRHCGSWPQTLEGVGLKAQRPIRRVDDTTLLAALRRAQAVHGGYLSVRVYDQLRMSRLELGLPLSGTVRMWLGSWQEALMRAGLETLAG